MKRLLAALVCSTALFAGATHAATVAPVSYVATPGQGQAQGGSYNYFDNTGRQLIDGIFGANAWDANLGNGEAYEWVGWLTTNPVITFDFGSTVNLTGIILGLNRFEPAGIYTSVVGDVNGQGFIVSQNAFPSNTRADLTFNFAQTIVASSVTLSLNDGNTGRWLFLDEIQFLGSSAPGTAVVPVPGALALMLPGLALLGAAARRRRSAAVA